MGQKISQEIQASKNIYNKDTKIKIQALEVTVNGPKEANEDVIPKAAN